MRRSAGGKPSALFSLLQILGRVNYLSSPMSTSNRQENEEAFRTLPARREHVPGEDKAPPDRVDSFVSLGSVAKRVADKARDGRRQGKSKGRDNMLEVHGIADGKKIMMVGETDNVPVKVVDRPNQKIEIVVGSSSAALTVEQAEFIATQLRSAIVRATGKPG